MAGMSAICVEQPPSAITAAHSAAIGHSLIVRLTGIPPKIPNYLKPPARIDIWIPWYELCNAKSSPALNALKRFKAMLHQCCPKRLEAQRANRAGAAAMCLNTQTLSQCSRVVNQFSCINPRGDERKTKL
jgi:hypothetical protein